ncbi:hypothetical protein QQF64_030039 [Cirrhinus molitorella]|uniref:Uncharacterized protein n=1 Tax=Cirrhinus molitorella TaxID=172907 RepID=A0ABR3N270_9TELE
MPLIPNCTPSCCSRGNIQTVFPYSIGAAWWHRMVPGECVSKGGCPVALPPVACAHPVRLGNKSSGRRGQVPCVGPSVPPFPQALAP